LALPSGRTKGREGDVRIGSATDLVEIGELVQSGGFVDKLEEMVVDLECRLLESLSPEQFATVQSLVQAAEILAEARAVLRAPREDVSVVTLRSGPCSQRRLGRRLRVSARP
jgi:hypothetical protein